MGGDSGSEGSSLEPSLPVVLVMGERQVMLLYWKEMVVAFSCGSSKTVKFRRWESSVGLVEVLRRLKILVVW